MPTGPIRPWQGLRVKLLLASLALVTASVVGTRIFVTTYVDSELTQQIRDDLKVRLALVERDPSATTWPLERTLAWDRLADDLGSRARARVTLIRLDGVVLGDSELPFDAVEQVENHANRPEVIEALAHGSGASRRYSTTRRQRMMYVAIPMTRDGRPVGVVRVAVPLDEVDGRIASLARMVSVASASSLVCVAIIAMVVARLLVRRVRRLTEVARRMADGDLEQRAEVSGGDELATLARALNQLIANLAQTVAQLRSERDVVGRVLEAMREGVLVLDAGRRVVLVNPALRDMLLLGSDIIGRTPLEATGNVELGRVLDDAAAAGEAMASELEIGGIKPRRLLVTAGPLPGEAGGLVAVFVDVTEMRQLETMRRDFVANVSHELRTPLSAIVAATETLQGGVLSNPESAKNFLGMIERNVQRLQRLLEDILELSRIEARQLNLSLESLDLLPVAQHNLGLFEHRASQKRIRLVADIPADLGLVVADRRGLDQVLSNLVDNAVKYCGEGATIVVRAVPMGPLVRISVADTGPGIERKHLPRLFERFYRVDSSRARDVGGTGLGLSIVKHMVEAMSGHVSVESEVGQGTTFTFTMRRA